MGHNGNPNSLANLRPPWTSETAPRRGGGNRPVGVTYAAEHLRTTLADATRLELERLRDDPNTDANLLTAVHVLLDATDAKAKPHERLQAAGELMDRQTGRPHQHQTVSVDTAPDPQFVVDQVRQQLRGTEAPAQLAADQDEHDSGG